MRILIKRIEKGEMSYLYLRPSSETNDKEYDDRCEIEEQSLHEVNFLEGCVDSSHNEEKDSARSQEGREEEQQLVGHVQYGHVLVDFDHRSPALNKKME